MSTTHATGPVVVGIDGSRAALDAVRFAAAEVSRRVASGRDTSLRLVHAIEPQLQPDPVRGAPDVDGDYARTVLDEAAAAARTAEPSIVVESVVVEGRPETVMRNETATGCLTVLGTTTENPLVAWVLGSMVGSVVEAAAGPVAIVRAFDEGRQGTVVAALGNTQVSSADVVVAQAFLEAEIRGASVLAVHTQAVPSMMANAIRGPIEDLRPESAMDVRLQPFGVDYPSVRVASVYAEADSGSELVDVSDTAQLLVLGHQRDRVPGSTLTTVLRHAHCPVLVVPHA